MKIIKTIIIVGLVIIFFGLFFLVIREEGKKLRAIKCDKECPVNLGAGCSMDTTQLGSIVSFKGDNWLVTEVKIWDYTEEIDIEFRKLPK